MIASWTTVCIELLCGFQEHAAKFISLAVLVPPPVTSKLNMLPTNIYPVRCTATSSIRTLLHGVYLCHCQANKRCRPSRKGFGKTSAFIYKSLRAESPGSVDAVILHLKWLEIWNVELMVCRPCFSSNYILNWIHGTQYRILFSSKLQVSWIGDTPTLSPRRRRS